METDVLSILLPAAVSLWAAIALIVLSALTSFITAAFGLGGGLVMLAVMATLLPPVALLPIHGVIQIGSNGGRAAIMLRQVRLEVLGPFVVGTVIGAALGGLISVRLPEPLFYFGLGLFVLWAAWGKAPPAFGKRAIFVGGVVSSFLTMFFGATGPFVAAVLKTLQLDRMSHVATQSACMVTQHGVKILVFGFLGFNYAPYAGLIIAMILTGFIGTVIGKRVLSGMGDERFKLALSIVLTLLALRLIWSGVATLLA
jgi:uncharacterized membrane protein YfcA